MDDHELEKFITFEFELYEHFENSFDKWRVDMATTYKNALDIPMLKVMNDELSPFAAELVQYFINRKIESCWLLLQSAFDLIKTRNIASTQVAMYPIIRSEVEQIAKLNWIFGGTLSVKKEGGQSKFSASGVRRPGAIKEIFERTVKLELCEILDGLKEEEPFVDSTTKMSQSRTLIDVQLQNVIKGISENCSEFDISSHSSSYKKMYDYAKSKQVFGYGIPDRTTLVANFITRYFSMSDIQAEERKPYALASFFSHSPDYAIMNILEPTDQDSQRSFSPALRPEVLDLVIMAQTFLVNIVCWKYLVFGFSDDYFKKDVLILNSFRNEFLDVFEPAT